MKRESEKDRKKWERVQKENLERIWEGVIFERAKIRGREVRKKIMRKWEEETN
jgi:hypothetical protein